MSEEEKEEEEEIPVEVLYGTFRAILAYFEKEFEKMPHPLRVLKFRRWRRDFEMFLEGFFEGVKMSEKLAREMDSQKPEKKKTIEVVEDE